MNMRVSDFIDIYFEDKKGELKERSIRNKKYMVKAHITLYFENKAMNSITPADLIQWQNVMREKRYSQTYLKMIQNQITALFTYAYNIYNLIVIGKRLMLSLAFPPLHTVRATFTAYGVPTINCQSLLHYFQRFYGVYLISSSLYYLISSLKGICLLFLVWLRELTYVSHVIQLLGYYTHLFYLYILAQYDVLAY